jgi:uncharacterized cupin superfamily protein
MCIDATSRPAATSFISIEPDSQSRCLPTAECGLVTNAGEEVLQEGDCAGIPAGVANGHHLQNRSDRPAVVLEIHPEADITESPHIDLRWSPTGGTRKDVTPCT